MGDNLSDEDFEALTVNIEKEGADMEVMENNTEEHSSAATATESVTDQQTPPAVAMAGDTPIDNVATSQEVGAVTAFNESENTPSIDAIDAASAAASSIGPAKRLPFKEDGKSVKDWQEFFNSDDKGLSSSEESFDESVKSINSWLQEASETQIDHWVKEMLLIPDVPAVKGLVTSLKHKGVEAFDDIKLEEFFGPDINSQGVQTGTGADEKLDGGSTSLMESVPSGEATSPNEEGNAFDELASSGLNVVQASMFPANVKFL